MSTWAGRKVRALVDLTLATKGTTCHLCGLDGADSADHDPPRSELARAGVPNPDSLAYLYPAHRHPCNIARQTRPITPDLQAELRVKRLAYLAGGQPPPGLSPRFRRGFSRAALTSEGSAFPFSPRPPTENQEAHDGTRT